MNWNNLNLKELKKRYLFIDDTFEWIKETSIGKFIIEKILFRSKSFYSIFSTLILILISQLSALKYSEELVLKIEEQINSSEGFINLLWQVANFFAPSGNLYIIFIILIVLPIVLLLRNKELNNSNITKIGWSVYENWACPSNKLEEEYIVSDKTIIYNEKNERKTLIHGLNELREKIIIEKNSIRLVGLSGVGKTRFVQAIFDERIGVNTPSSSLVHYTDMSRNPNPSPTSMIEQLHKFGKRAIIIVDNCPPDLHRELVKGIGKETSKLSLLTVEYDVRDDLPDETDVFKLEPNSIEVIEKIIANRFNYISQIDRRSISEFSGGNARIAIALANTIKRSETLTGFNDEELFKRLFQQRNGSNENLIKSAESLSLVYSFNGESTDDTSELKFLANIIGKNTLELYRDIEELKRRDLVQVRGDWRAMLPHAISNRLAKKALESFPKDYIVNKFLESGSDRLIKSFVHRLSFLHDSEVVISIAEDWLKEDGWLGKNKCNFNELGMYVFKNIASVSPEKALECIERAAEDKCENFFDTKVNHNSMYFINILRHFAYDAEYFDKSVQLICQFVVFEKIEDEKNTSEEVLKSLFWLTLSGTNALADQRIKIISKLLKSENKIEQNIGMSTLSASLKTSHFTSSSDFSFGARLRGYGWNPETYLDTTQWYAKYIGLCSEIALSSSILSKQARKLLADEFRGLWNNAFNYDLLVETTKKVHDIEPWTDGWFAINESIGFDEKRYSPEILEKITMLKEYLIPNSLYEKAQVYISPDKYSLYDYHFDESEEDREKKEELLQKDAFSIGKMLSTDKKVLESLMKSIVISNNYMINFLVKGLATHYANKDELWSLFYKYYVNTPKADKKFDSIQSLLSYWANKNLVFFNKIMDIILLDEYFCEYYPLLQTVHIDSGSLLRLHKSIDLNKAPLWQYKNLAYGRRHEMIKDDDLTDFLNHLLTCQNGIDIVIEIINMRFHGKTKEEHSKPLIELSYKVLSLYPFDKKESGSRDDHKLETIAKTCVNNSYNQTAGVLICEALAKGRDSFRISDYHKFINIISQKYPVIFLNVLFTDKIIESGKPWGFGSFYIFDSNNSLLDNIPEDELLKWCDKKEEIRYPFAASIIYPLILKDNIVEIKPIIYKFLDKTSVMSKFLEELKSFIAPMSYSGSRASIIEKRIVLFTILEEYDNDFVKQWAKEEYAKYSELIKKIRIDEQKRDEDRYETFE